MIKLAMPASTLQKKLQEAQMPKYNMMDIPTQQSGPSIAQQFGDRMVDRGIEKGMEQVGKEGLKAGLSAAGTAAGGPMGAVAGQVAGELAAPFLKSMLYSLFNKGGFVGPLAPQYKGHGGMMIPMDISDTMMGLMRLYGMR
jgi:hypothetical protein